MKFELLPIVDTMVGLYQKPLNPQRFQAYLGLLEGGEKGEMKMPIVGFNPMAKDHVLDKLLAMKALNAEGIMQEAISAVNEKASKLASNRVIKVAFNLADDLAGGWTNRFTTDFDSKFKINALISRNFCTPFFWTSEEITEQLIKTRTAEYAYRTIYWLENPKPTTLGDHVKQELFVAKNTNPASSGFDTTAAWYENNAYSEDYNLIFNFFYGDAASRILGFRTFGCKGFFNE